VARIKKVADGAARSKKPRIRKSAPTIRERAEAAQAEAEKPKKKRLKRPALQLPKFIGRWHLPNNKFFELLKPGARRAGRVLRWLAPKYFINSWRELRRVIWPNRRETWRLTLAVFIFAIIFGAMVAGVDKGLDEIFKHFIIK
jgi:preprotein translocase subunit SecE